jgi:hypothetical protein
MQRGLIKKEKVGVEKRTESIANKVRVKRIDDYARKNSHRKKMSKTTCKTIKQLYCEAIVT